MKHLLIGVGDQPCRLTSRERDGGSCDSFELTSSADLDGFKQFVSGRLLPTGGVDLAVILLRIPAAANDAGLDELCSVLAAPSVARRGLLCLIHDDLGSDCTLPQGADRFAHHVLVLPGLCPEEELAGYLRIILQIYGEGHLSVPGLASRSARPRVIEFKTSRKAGPPFQPCELFDATVVTAAAEARGVIAEDLAEELKRLDDAFATQPPNDIGLLWGRLSAIGVALKDVLSAEQEDTAGQAWRRLEFLPRLQSAEAILWRSLAERASALGFNLPGIQISSALVERCVFDAAVNTELLRAQHDKLVEYSGRSEGLAKPFAREGGSPFRKAWNWLERAWRGALPVRDSCRNLAGYCLQLLHNPDIQRRLLATLVCSALDRCSKADPAGGNEWNWKSALQPWLDHLFGARVVVGIPSEALLDDGDRDSLKRWVEDRSGSPCRLAVDRQGEGWIYWERSIDWPIEPRPRMVQPVTPMQPSSPAQPFPDGATAVGVDSAPLGNAAGCSVCGVAESGSDNCDRDFDRCPARESYEPPKTCPKCGRYNRKLWWQCCRHGKIPVDVSVADERCPECILRHHRDPANFPLTSISLRPDLLRPVFCPHCARIHCRNARHPRFRIPREILPYYRNGVTASEKEDFLKLAREQGLAEDSRCPNCRTLLIPIHHREGGTCEDTRAGGSAALPAPYHPSP